MRSIIVIISLVFVYITYSKKIYKSVPTVKSKINEDENVYELLSNAFIHLDYEKNEIQRALKKIASNQATLKSMDGVTHQLRHTLGESTSLSSRLKKFLKGKKKNLKEASKVLEYITTVERALHACEILSAISYETTPTISSSSTRTISNTNTNTNDSKKKAKNHQNDNNLRMKLIDRTNLIEKEYFDMEYGNIKWRISILVPSTTPNTNKTTTTTTSSNDNNNNNNNSGDSMKVDYFESIYEPYELIIAITDITYTSSTTTTTPTPTAISSGSNYPYTPSSSFSKHIINILQLIHGNTDESSSTIIENPIDHISLLSAGLVSEDVTIHKSILRMTIMTLEKISSYLLATVPTLVNVTVPVSPNKDETLQPGSSSSSSSSSKNDDHITSSKKNNKSKSLPKSSKMKPNTLTIAEDEMTYINTTKVEYIPMYTHIRVIGYSIGGSISAYLSMLLDGTLNITLPSYIYDSNGKIQLPSTDTLLRGDYDKDSDKVDNVIKSKKNKIKKNVKRKNAFIEDNLSPVDASTTTTSTSDKESLSSTNNSPTQTSSRLDLSTYIGRYQHHIKCICISPVPCISRMIIPQYITSIICGDDIIPRATPETMKTLEKRLSEALKNGIGKKNNSIKWNMGGEWMKDLKKLATNSINQYASGSHDVNSLTVPGRVFYVKARKLKKGGSIQRVFRGNWREDMLWLLHEVLLSTKMFKHHDLMYCAQILSRV